MFNLFNSKKIINLSDAINIKIDYSPIKIEFANRGSIKTQSESDKKSKFHLNKIKS
jgi:hypothetical protein